MNTLLFLGATLLLQQVPPSYNGRDKQIDVAIPRIESEIEVDGVLDEPAWQNAARLTGFSQYQPVDG
ncbi:MAG: hypothetical protein KDD65_03845, partial [Bacteroidetes bacterium]|nr:hypothetical protein [Bacteroidota bacterium]